MAKPAPLQAPKASVAKIVDGRKQIDGWKLSILDFFGSHEYAYESV